MLSNASFLAKFRFDTAENEPAKSLQNSFKICQKRYPAIARDAFRQATAEAVVEDLLTEIVDKEVRGGE